MLNIIVSQCPLEYDMFMHDSNAWVLFQGGLHVPNKALLVNGPVSEGLEDSMSFQYDSQHMVLLQSSSVDIRVDVLPRKPWSVDLARSRHMSPKYFPITMIQREWPLGCWTGC